MKKVLGLDISSSTIGWCLLEYDAQVVNLVSYGHIKPPPKKKGSFPFRLDFTYKAIEDLIKQLKPNEIAVEDYAKKFSKGRSTANTIIVLSVFNEVCCLVSYRKLKKEPFRYPVATIRAQLGRLFNTKIVSKDDVFPEIVKNCSRFQVKLNRNLNTKKESGDEADAIAVAITHILKTQNQNPSWNL
jgi:Holliday junction resolvasome RuvABC endonuclease subunit